MKKKKAKYRHIEINKKKYYFYHIVWLDILGVMNTYAYIYKKTKKFILTFSSYDDENFSDRNAFPIGVIQETKKIEI